MRRATAATVALVTGPAPDLPPDHTKYLDTFRPQTVPAADLDQVRAAVVAVMSRAAHIHGLASFKKRVSDVTALADWAHTQGRDLSWTSLMTHETIHDFTLARRGHASEANQAHQMNRLKVLASRLNPGPGAPPVMAPTSYRTIQPPYSQAQMAAILRAVRHQPRPATAKRLAALVGLARGAGATSAELSGLRARDVSDLGSEGVLVSLGTDPRRTVAVRRQYEDLVRAGIADLKPAALVLGGRNDRRIVAHLIEDAVILSTDVPHIDAARLRTTWLAELMGEPVPLHVLLAAAGLRSARTITDLFRMLTPAELTNASQVLRGQSR